MIANERQYRVSRRALRRFEEAARQRRTFPPAEGVDPRLGKVMIDALEGQAETLREEIQRYEDLRDGRVARRELEGLRDLPTALVEGRIVARLTQRQLGERLGVKEQQVQRWEANLYAGVALERVQEVADALGMGVTETVSYAIPG